MSTIQQAFHAAIADAQKPSVFYVVLWKRATSYGGPEEGGWWRHHRIVEAFSKFTTEDAANAAMEAVIKLAEQMTANAQREHGTYCLRSVEEAEARGLEASDLPEVDGPDKYSVSVQAEWPENYIDNSHWE